MPRLGICRKKALNISLRLFQRLCNFRRSQYGTVFLLAFSHNEVYYRTEPRLNSFYTIQSKESVSYCEKAPMKKLPVYQIQVLVFKATGHLKHKILLDDYKVRPELNKHKNI